MGTRDDFDFWLGTWRATWGDEDAQGTNTITKEYAGHVVYERFDGRPGAEFTGMSVSVFDEVGDCWRQTWVDDAGNYLEMAGGLSDGEMQLICNANGTSRESTFRMRFSEITDTSFEWSWEREVGGDWEVAWAISYERIAIDN